MPFVTRLENFGLITKNKGLNPRTHAADADLSGYQCKCYFWGQMLIPGFQNPSKLYNFANKSGVFVQNVFNSTHH